MAEPSRPFATPGGVAGDDGPGFWLAALLGTGFAVLAGAIGIAPRLVPWVLLVLAAIAVAAEPGRLSRCLRAALTGRAAMAVLALPALGLVSALWSADRAATLDTVLRALALAVAVLIVIGAVGDEMERRGQVWRRRYLRAIPIGGLCGLAFMLCETATRGAVTRTVLSVSPGLIGQRGKGLMLAGGVVTDIYGFVLNRNVAGLVLLAPPLLLATWYWLHGRGRALVLGATCAALPLVVVASDSETAKLALAAAVLAVLAGLWSVRGTTIVLGLALTAGLLFTLPLARLPHTLGLHESTRIAFSHRDRVQIWQVNAEVAARHPLLGAGVEAARIEQEKLIAARTDRSQVTEPRRPGWHAHNFYLQVRAELGLLGSLAALVFGLTMLAAVLRLHPAVAPWGLGLVAATMATGITGWGLWQDWFLAGLGVDAAFLVLIDRFVRSCDRASSCPPGRAW